MRVAWDCQVRAWDGVRHEWGSMLGVWALEVATQDEPKVRVRAGSCWRRSGLKTDSAVARPRPGWRQAMRTSRSYHLLVHDSRIDLIQCGGRTLPLCTILLPAGAILNCA